MKKKRTYLHKGMNAGYLDDVSVDFVILTNVVLSYHGFGTTTSQGSVARQRRHPLQRPAGRWLDRDLDHFDGRCEHRFWNGRFLDRRRRWKTSLVSRLLGRRVSFPFLSNQQRGFVLLAHHHLLELLPVKLCSRHPYKTPGRNYQIRVVRPK
jgi:hypothetical protein